MRDSPLNGRINTFKGRDRYVWSGVFLQKLISRKNGSGKFADEAGITLTPIEVEKMGKSLKFLPIKKAGFI